MIGFNNFVHARCPFASSRACSCGRYACHLDSLIVAVDGACRGNGVNATRSAAGVYYGPSDHGNLNFAFEVPAANQEPKHTSQRAELWAAIAALMNAQYFTRQGGQWPCDDEPHADGHGAEPCRVRHLIIKSDSAYLVNGMTGTLARWATNGWLTARRTRVKNVDLWEQLLALVTEYEEDLEASVDFWLVPRAENADADRLADLGLDNPVDSIHGQPGFRLVRLGDAEQS